MLNNMNFSSPRNANLSLESESRNTELKDVLDVEKVDRTNSPKRNLQYDVALEEGDDESLERLLDAPSFAGSRTGETSLQDKGEDIRRRTYWPLVFTFFFFMTLAVVTGLSIRNLWHKFLRRNGAQEQGIIVVSQSSSSHPVPRSTGERSSTPDLVTEMQSGRAAQRYQTGSGAKHFEAPVVEEERRSNKGAGAAAGTIKNDLEHAVFDSGEKKAESAQPNTVGTVRTEIDQEDRRQRQSYQAQHQHTKDTPESELTAEELKTFHPSHYTDKILADLYRSKGGAGQQHLPLPDRLQPLPEQLRPQPITSLPDEHEIVDYGYTFSWPTTEGMSESDVVQAFCRGIDGRHADRRIRLYLLVSATREYTENCQRVMFQRFRGGPDYTDHERTGEDDNQAQEDRRASSRDSRPKLAWGNFAELSFFYPDGEKVTTRLPGGFPTATFVLSESPRPIPPADTEDLTQIWAAVAATHQKIPNSLTWFVTEVNYEDLGVITTADGVDHPTEKTVDGDQMIAGGIPPRTAAEGTSGSRVSTGVVRSEIIVNTGRVGLQDTHDLATGTADGVGIWMVQTAKEFEHQSSCAGPTLFLFDYIIKYRPRLSFLAHINRISILDASWSYLGSRGAEKELLPEDKTKWLDRTRALRERFFVLADPKVSDKAKMEARAFLLENVKTPGRNCYLYPKMSGRPEFQCIKEWDGSVFPNGNEPGRFPGVFYYIYDLPPGPEDIVKVPDEKDHAVVPG